MTAEEIKNRLKAKINLINDFLGAIDIRRNMLNLENNAALKKAIEAVVGFELDKELRLTNILRNPFLEEYKIDLKKYSNNIPSEIGILRELLNGIINEQTDLIYLLVYSLLDLLPLDSSKTKAQEYTTISQYALEEQPWARLSDLLDSLLTISNFFEVEDGRINWDRLSDTYVVSIKIRDIHNLLGEAKKMRELYMNSFLISILVWLIAEKYVRELGGDILLTPNIRRTPMLGMLIKKNERLHLDYDIKKLMNLSKKVTFYSIYESSYRYPIFATIPGEVILILPKNVIKNYSGHTDDKDVTIDTVLEMMDRDMRKLQRDIIMLAKKHFLRYIKDLDYYEKTAFCDYNAKDKSLDQEQSNQIRSLRRFADFVCRAFMLAEKYGFFDAPLLNYDIYVLEVSYKNKKLSFNFASSVYRKAKEIFSGGVQIKPPKSECSQQAYNSSPVGWIRQILECLKKTIWSEEIKQFLSSPPPEEIRAITRYTKDIYEDEVNYFPELYEKSKHHHCSVCGRRPAILGLPPYKNQERTPLNYEDIVPWILQPYFDAREHLCAYCLIKRILIIPEIFKDTFKELFNIRISPLPKFVSTTHLAIMENTLASVEEGNFELLRTIKRKIDETVSRPESIEDFAYIMRKRRIIEDYLRKRKFKDRLRLYPLFIRNLYSRIDNTGDDEIKKGFIYLMEIPLYELIRLGLNQLGNIDVNNYVTLMYCDGDNFTKFILLNFDAKKELTPIGRLDIESIRKKIFNGRSVGFSILYYRTISYAISVSSGIEQALFLEERDKIRTGDGKEFTIPLLIPVLFGGDDAILFTTVNGAFTSYELLRKIFTNGIREEEDGIIINPSKEEVANSDSPTGFNIYRGIVTHAFPHLVRSFHISFIHHKYPLGRAVLNTILGLDAKDDIKIEFPTGLSKKDVVIISLLGRGQTSIAVAPISLMDNHEVRYTDIPKEKSSMDLQLSLYNKIFGVPNDRILSVSFLYDIFGSEELRILSKRRDDLAKELRLRLLDYIITRNIINTNKRNFEELRFNKEYINYLFDTFLTVDVGKNVIVKNINEMALLYIDLIEDVYGETRASALFEVIRGLMLYKNAKKTIRLRELVSE